MGSAPPPPPPTAALSASRLPLPRPRDCRDWSRASAAGSAIPRASHGGGPPPCCRSRPGERAADRRLSRLLERAAHAQVRPSPSSRDGIELKAALTTPPSERRLAAGGIGLSRSPYRRWQPSRAERRRLTETSPVYSFGTFGLLSAMPTVPSGESRKQRSDGPRAELCVSDASGRARSGPVLVTSTESVMAKSESPTSGNCSPRSRAVTYRNVVMITWWRRPAGFRFISVV